MAVDEVEYLVTVRPQPNQVTVSSPGPPGPPGTGGGGSANLEIVDAGWQPSYAETYAPGDMRFAEDGVLWICFIGGSPGGWYSIEGFELWTPAGGYPSINTFPSSGTFPIASGP
jgi:hypothetical protein